MLTAPRARIKSRDRILSGGHTVLVLEPGLNEHDYLRQIELLALDVVAAAREEGWLTYGDDPAGACMARVYSAGDAASMPPSTTSVWPVT